MRLQNLNSVHRNLKTFRAYACAVERIEVSNLLDNTIVRGSRVHQSQYKETLSRRRERRLQKGKIVPEIPSVLIEIKSVNFDAKVISIGKYIASTLMTDLLTPPSVSHNILIHSVDPADQYQCLD